MFQTFTSTDRARRVQAIELAGVVHAGLTAGCDAVDRAWTSRSTHSTARVSISRDLDGAQHAQNHDQKLNVFCPMPLERQMEKGFSREVRGWS